MVENETTTYHEAIEFLIRQQFHKRQNTITDRVKQREVVIKGADRVIDRLLDHLVLLTKLWIKKRRNEYSKQVSAYLNIDYASIKEELEQKIIEMEEIQSPDVVVYMGVLGKLLGEFRTSINELLVQKIVETKPVFIGEEEFLLSQLGYQESLLANVSVLYRFAELVNVQLADAIKTRLFNETIEVLKEKLEKKKLT